MDLGCQSQFLPLSLSTLTSTKSFWDSIWSPGSRGCIRTENTSFGGFSTGCWWNRGLRQIGCNISQTSLSGAFCGRQYRLGHHANLATLCTSVHHCVMGPASGRILYICKTYRSFRCHNGTCIEQMWNQQFDRHRSALFRATISSNKRWVPIHWKKSQLSPQLITLPCISSACSMYSRIVSHLEGALNKALN